MTDSETGKRQDPGELLPSVRRRLRQLTVAVVLMTLALFLTCAAVFGNLVNWFGRDPALYGGSLAGAAIMGFLFGCFAGWFARGRR